MFHVCALLSGVLNLDEKTLVFFVPMPSKTAAKSVFGLDMNQSLSQPPKCILLTPHEAPELTKLQAASYVGVR